MTYSPRANERDILLDVSRLVWRAWRHRLPTGIDRVCLAYLDHFGARSQAVVQRSGFHFMLSAQHSDRLFSLLLDAGSSRRTDLLRLATLALTSTIRSAPRSGMTYLNVGHTGLNEPSLPAWIARHRLRAVYLVHDLIPLTHPEYCRPGEAGKHQARMKNLLASAAGVIGNSRTTLDELAAFAAANGATMPPNVPALISGYDGSITVRPRSYPKPYFVTVGTIEGRKNHLLLLQIWRRLVADMGDNAPTLVIIGQRGWLAESALAILDNPGELAGHVLELGRCEDEDLARWIAGARALLMPSFAEGFGLPIIEALQLSTPVIASDLPVYREIAGMIPTYIDPRDAVAWDQRIRDFMGESPERHRQLMQIKSYRAPNWTSHFAIVDQWLQSRDAAEWAVEGH